MNEEIKQKRIHRSKNNMVNVEVRQRCDSMLFEFGQKVRMARIKAGKTQAEFSREMGYAEGSGALPINKIENGRKDLSLLTMLEISDKIGYELSIKILPKTSTIKTIVAESKEDVDALNT